MSYNWRNIFGINLGESVGRTINLYSVGKERKQLLRAILAAGEILSQRLQGKEKPDLMTKDLMAFIAMALKAVHQTIERTVIPWEKRNYWVKADQFRKEWAWSGELSNKLQQALSEQNWNQATQLFKQVLERVEQLETPQRRGLGTPWVGAWEKLTQS
jgi:hypothetical protein